MQGNRVDATGILITGAFLRMKNGGLVTQDVANVEVSEWEVNVSGFDPDEHDGAVFKCDIGEKKYLIFSTFQSDPVPDTVATCTIDFINGNVAEIDLATALISSISDGDGSQKLDVSSSFISSVLIFDEDGDARSANNYTFRPEVDGRMSVLGVRDADTAILVGISNGGHRVSVSIPIIKQIERARTNKLAYPEFTVVSGEKTDVTINLDKCYGPAVLLGSQGLHVNTNGFTIDSVSSISVDGPLATCPANKQVLNERVLTIKDIDRTEWAGAVILAHNQFDNFTIIVNIGS